MPYEMKGGKQLIRSATAKATPGSLWRILADSRLLPRWAPAVHSVERCDSAGEAVGSVRHCNVELGGRPGKLVERCVDIAVEQSIAYVVDDDSFGMNGMFADYGFRISLKPLDECRTEVVFETYYTPRGVVYAWLNAIVMRRRFRRVVDRLLGGLLALAEGREPETWESARGRSIR